MLELTNIALKAGNKKLFELSSLRLDNGLIALVGRNGSGKSTFLRMILGDHKNFSGSVLINNKKDNEITSSVRAQLISVVYTKPEIFGNHTVHEVLLLGRIPYQNIFAQINEVDLQKVKQIAALLEIEELLESNFSILSDGEKQLVMIGRALVQDTPIVLLDEPAAFLDLVNRYKLAQILKRIVSETNKLIIYSTHHVDLLDDYCKGVLLITDNQMEYLTESNLFAATIKEKFGIK